MPKKNVQNPAPLPSLQHSLIAGILSRSRKQLQSSQKPLTSALRGPTVPRLKIPWTKKTFVRRAPCNRSHQTHIHGAHTHTKKKIRTLFGWARGFDGQKPRGRLNLKTTHLPASSTPGRSGDRRPRFCWTASCKLPWSSPRPLFPPQPWLAPRPHFPPLDPTTHRLLQCQLSQREAGVLLVHAQPATSSIGWRERQQQGQETVDRTITVVLS